MQVALQELRESNYWLRLLDRAEKLPANRLAGILDESNQLRAMLSKAVATAKAKAKSKTYSATSMLSAFIFAFCLLIYLFFLIFL